MARRPEGPRIIPEGVSREVLVKRRLHWWLERPGLWYGSQLNRVDGWYGVIELIALTASADEHGNPARLWEWRVFGPEGDSLTHPVVRGTTRSLNDARRDANLAVVFLPERGQHMTMTDSGGIAS